MKKHVRGSRKRSENVKSHRMKVRGRKSEGRTHKGDKSALMREMRKKRKGRRGRNKRRRGGKRKGKEGYDGKRTASVRERWYGREMMIDEEGEDGKIGRYTERLVDNHRGETDRDIGKGRVREREKETSIRAILQPISNYWENQSCGME